MEDALGLGSTVGEFQWPSGLFPAPLASTFGGWVAWGFRVGWEEGPIAATGCVEDVGRVSD